MSRVFIGTQTGTLSTYLESSGANFLYPINATYTISAWIFPTTWGGPTGLGPGIVFNSDQLSLFTSAGGVLTGRTSYKTTTSQSVSEAGVIKLYQWQYVTYIINVSTFTSTIYVNGFLIPQTQTTGAGTGTSAQACSVGSVSNGSGGFTGLIDSVCIWNGVLSQADIVAAMAFQGPLTVQTASQVGYWPLIGTTSPDIDIPPTHPFILYNAPAQGPNSPGQQKSQIFQGVSLRDGYGVPLMSDSAQSLYVDINRIGNVPMNPAAYGTIPTGGAALPVNAFVTNPVIIAGPTDFPLAGPLAVSSNTDYGIAAIGVYELNDPAMGGGNTAGLQLDQGANLKVVPGQTYSVLPTITTTNWGVLGNTIGLGLTNSTGNPASIVWFVPSGTITTGSVKFQGSRDSGLTWQDLLPHEVLDPTSPVFAELPMPYTFVSGVPQPVMIAAQGYTWTRMYATAALTGGGTVPTYYTQICFVPKPKYDSIVPGVPTIGQTTRTNTAVVSSGWTSLVAASGTATVRLWRLVVSASSATNVEVGDGTNVFLGPYYLTANGSIVLDISGEPWCVTGAGAALEVNSSNAGALTATAWTTQS